MKSFKRAMKVLSGVALSLLIAVPAYAEETVQAVSEIAVGNGLKFLAIGLTIAIAAAGTAVGMGLAAGRALESIGRNPAVQWKVFVLLIIALAIIEANVIYALVIIFSKLA